MPPRFSYWTILIDDQPTAFRAARRDELQPTLAQLQRTNANVVMKWFARGRLWDTPEQAQWAARNAESLREKRGRDWRPGGSHRDPRAQFERRKKKHTDDRRPWKPKAEGSGKRHPSHAKGPDRRVWTPRPVQGERDQRVRADRSKMPKRVDAPGGPRRRRKPGEEER